MKEPHHLQKRWAFSQTFLKMELSFAVLPVTVLAKYNYHVHQHLDVVQRRMRQKNWGLLL